MPAETQDDQDIILAALSKRERTALHDFLKRNSRPRDGAGTVEDHLLVSLSLALRSTNRMT